MSVFTRKDNCTIGTDAGNFGEKIEDSQKLADPRISVLLSIQELRKQLKSLKTYWKFVDSKIINKCT